MAEMRGADARVYPVSPYTVPKLVPSGATNLSKKKKKKKKHRIQQLPVITPNQLAHDKGPTGCP